METINILMLQTVEDSHAYTVEDEKTGKPKVVYAVDKFQKGARFRIEAARGRKLIKMDLAREISEEEMTE